MIEIVKANATHVDGIVECWIEFADFHAALDPHFTRAADGHVTFGKYISEAMASPTSLVLAAIDKSSVVGYALSTVANYPPPLAKRVYGLISDMAVASAYRHHGIGAALTEKTIGWFAAQGIDRVELRVVAANKVGRSFWRKQGFKEYIMVMYQEVDPKR
jgi:ribosomal protein S18 acetylase RimI-like enzyme